MANVQKGLEGVLAAETKVSSIIDSQLTYAGYDIDDLANNAEFEEIIFLLWHYRLPNAEELKTLKEKLLSYMELNPRVYSHFKEYATDNVHPMTALRTSVSYIAHFDSKAETEDDAETLERGIRIQAKIASLVTAFARVREGKDPVKPNKDLNYAGNFLYMLRGELPTDIEVEAFNKALVLHADHEFNASTFTARCAVSSLSDMYSGIVAAVGSLKGPLHGGANERVMSMLAEVKSEDEVDEYIDNKIKNKEKIMGFGHRVYKNFDPRATVMRQTCHEVLAELNIQDPLLDIAMKLEQIALEDPYFVEKKLYPNVDFYSGIILKAIGIPTSMFTVIFAMSRTVGWISHWDEMLSQPGHKISRPRQLYTGETSRDYVPTDKR